jgi:ABC-2 type transport system ATP-binding protein
MDNIIEIKDATKTFRDTKALQNISINFERNKIHGIIGRNGSGKTVLFKCICGFMNLSEGEILINDEKVQHARAQDIGIIIENPGFIGSMSGFKNLSMLASIHRRIDKIKIAEVMNKVGLDAKMKKHVRKYSLGMRHRLGIAQAIMENPSLLILDEPMNGLDKQGVLEIRELFKSLRDAGATVIFSSHYAEDIDALCDTVYEMDAGRLTCIRS